MSAPRFRMRSPGLKNVAVHDGFWSPRIETNRTATLPAEYEQCRKTARLEAWKLKWKPGRKNQPHHFWDSDVAKWIEAAAYSLAVHPDAKLSRLVDGVVDDIGERYRGAPYPVPLRDIQIKIRVFEPDSHQIREVTVVQDFMPK